MAKKPDGKPARVERVTFTKPAAERIGKVVRTVEAGNRDQGPLTFGPRVGLGGGTPIRLAYYTATANWLPGPISEDATANTNYTTTISFALNTANTALCVNNMSFLPLITTNQTAATRTILTYKEGGQWRLMGARS